MNDRHGRKKQIEPDSMEYFKETQGKSKRNCVISHYRYSLKCSYLGMFPYFTSLLL